MCKHNRFRSARAGFTLAEMMIAIAIIAVLIALSAAAVFRFMDTGPYNATVANINKVKAVLDTQWAEVRQKAMKESMAPYEPNLSYSLNDDRARGEFVDLRIRQAFPVSFAEALNPASPPPAGKSLGAYGPYRQFLGSLLQIPNGDSDATASTKAMRCAPPHVQQAILLLMILERGPSNSGTTADKIAGGMVKKLDLKVALDSGAAASADGLVDGWGRALMFTRNYQPDPTGAKPRKMNELVLLSLGVMRGNLKPWDRVRIDAINPGSPWAVIGPPSKPGLDWDFGDPLSARRPWNPNPDKLDLQAITPEDQDQVVTTYTSKGKS